MKVVYEFSREEENVYAFHGESVIGYLRLRVGEVTDVLFCYVEEGHRGKGVGTGLYLAVAQALASQSTFLRSDTFLSQEAEKLWKRLKQLYPDRVVWSPYIERYLFRLSGFELDSLRNLEEHHPPKS